MLLILYIDISLVFIKGANDYGVGIYLATVAQRSASKKKKAECLHVYLVSEW